MHQEYSNRRRTREIYCLKWSCAAFGELFFDHHRKCGNCSLQKFSLVFVHFVHIVRSSEALNPEVVGLESKFTLLLPVLKNLPNEDDTNLPKLGLSLVVSASSWFFVKVIGVIRF
jgi:hypothetical protein